MTNTYAHLKRVCRNERKVVAHWHRPITNRSVWHKRFQHDKIRNERERERERERENLHFPAGVTPVIPAFGNDNIVHISVGKDHPGEGTPCPPKEQSS